jgi:hypothetical protein
MFFTTTTMVDNLLLPLLTMSHGIVEIGTGYYRNTAAKKIYFLYYESYKRGAN